KVIEDRAKRESLVWFLEQMHEHVCGADDPEQCQTESAAVTATCTPKPPAMTLTDKELPACNVARKQLDTCRSPITGNIVRREIRTYWLPNTCALAGNRMDFVQYGGGANLVRAL